MYESVICISNLFPYKGNLLETCKEEVHTRMFSMLKCIFYGNNSVMWWWVKVPPGEEKKWNGISGVRASVHVGDLSRDIIYPN